MNKPLLLTREDQRYAIAELEQFADLSRRWLDYSLATFGRDTQEYHSDDKYVLCFFANNCDYKSARFEGVCGIACAFFSSYSRKRRITYHDITVETLLRLPEIIKTYSKYLSDIEADNKKEGATA